MVATLERIELEPPHKLTILTSVEGDKRELTIADQRFAHHRPSETVLNAELKRQFPSLYSESGKALYDEIRGAYRESEYDRAVSLVEKMRDTEGWYPPAEWIATLSCEAKHLDGIDESWHELTQKLLAWRDGVAPSNLARLEGPAKKEHLNWLLSSIRFNQGERARETGDFNESAALLREARELGTGLSDDAREAKLRINEAYALAKLGATGEAIGVLKPVLQMDTAMIAEILERKSAEVRDLAQTLNTLK